MRTFKSIFVTLGLLLLLITSCSPEDTSLDASNYQIDLDLVSETNWEMAEEVLVLVNAHRASIGQGSIKIDKEHASAYAVDHTKYMMDMQQINHDNFHYRTQALKSHGAQRVGENVAYGYNSAEDVVTAWLNSPSHRRAIEGDYTHSGFGIIATGNNRYYFTQLFYKE